LAWETIAKTPSSPLPAPTPIVHFAPKIIEVYGPTSYPNVKINPLKPKIAIHNKFIHPLAQTSKTNKFTKLHNWRIDPPMYSGVTPGLSPCAIPKDSAHIVANFDTLPSARKLLFIHEILRKTSLLG
jgi:hypothetical protein